MHENNTKPVEGPILLAIADDHEAFRKGICLYLESLGGLKFIIEAENGKVLIDRIKKSKIKPEICIIDIQMPEMNGFETVTAIKENWEDMHVLVISSFMDDWHAEKMIMLGASGYLSKDTSPKEIKNAIETISKYGVYFTEFFSHKKRIFSERNKLELPALTPMEMKVLKFSNQELTWGEIAEELKTTQKSVEGYRNSLYRKLGVKSKVGLLLFAIRAGVIPVSASGASLL